MSVARCKQEVDSAEFTKWMVYMSHELVGHRGNDIRNAQLMAVISNASESIKRKGGGQFSTQDFTIEYWKNEEDNQKTMWNTLQALANKQNATINNRESK